MTKPTRLLLREGELANLLTLCEEDPLHRGVLTAFGTRGVWLVPDEQGNYPRWILEALAKMRGIEV